MITSMTGKPEPVTAADRRSFDLVTRWLVLSLPAAFLAHDIGDVRGNADLNSALAGLSDRIPSPRDWHPRSPPPTGRPPQRWGP
jgi:hypothetical protein